MCSLSWECGIISRFILVFFKDNRDFKTNSRCIMYNRIGYICLEKEGMKK